MDTAKELNTAQNGSYKGNGIENRSTVWNSEVVATNEQMQQLNDISMETENLEVKPNHSYGEMQVENDQQAVLVTQEDKENLYSPSLKKTMKITYCKKTSGMCGIKSRRKGKISKKSKTISLRRRALILTTVKRLLSKQEELPHEINKFQHESRNVQNDTFGIVDGDLEKKTDIVKDILSKLNEVLYKPISINQLQVLKTENLSSSIPRSTYAPDVQGEKSGNADIEDTAPDVQCEKSGNADIGDTAPDVQCEKSGNADIGDTAPDVQGEESGNADIGDTAPDVQGEKSGSADTEDKRTKSEKFMNLLKVFPSMKVMHNPISENELKDSTNENRLSSSSKFTSAPIISQDTTKKSQYQKIKPPAEVWAHFLRSIKTNKESVDEIGADDVYTGNAETLESMNLGFKDPTNRERDSTGKNFGELIEIETDNATTEVWSDLKSENSVTRYGTEFTHQVSGKENSLSGSSPSISTSIIRYGTEFTQQVPEKENSLSGSSPSTSTSIISNTTMENKTQKSKVWDHFKLYLKRNKESLDRIFPDCAINGAESENHNLKDPTNTVRDTASQNSGEIAKTKKEIVTTEIPDDLKSGRTRTWDVTEFIYLVRNHFLKKILPYELNLKRIREKFKNENDMEKKIEYVTDARDLQHKIHTCFNALYDEKFIFLQLKRKLSSSSVDINLLNPTSLVDFPMSTRRIQSLSLLFLYLYKSLYYKVPVENIFENINFENYVLAYKKFQEEKVVEERARKKSEAVAFKLVDCFNASLEECLVKFKDSSPPFQNKSLEDYQIYIHYLRKDMIENLKCLKKLISFGSSVAFPVVNYLCHSRLIVLRKFHLLEEKRPDIFNSHKKAD